MSTEVSSLQVDTLNMLANGIIVCPACKGHLRTETHEVVCKTCGRKFPIQGGLLELLTDRGARFGDSPNPARDLQEVRGQDHQVRQFWVPLLHKIFSSTDMPIRVLSVGCGVGQDVDVLNEMEYEAFGLDCGSRASAWPQRNWSSRLLLADVQEIPFPDNYFDFVFGECILPHVGTVGDSVHISSDYQEKRLKAALEMTRVVSTGGWIAHATPNRRFPLDFWHLDTDHSYFGLFRLHSSSDKMLLSLKDHCNLFINEAGCRQVRIVSALGRWGFYRKRSRMLTALLVVPMKAFLTVIAKSDWLLRSVVNPFLVVLFQK